MSNIFDKIFLCNLAFQICSMNFSKNQYLLNTPHPANVIAERLYNDTYITDRLVRVRTENPFIGEVDEEGFYLMGSSYMGVLCTLNGKFVTDGQNTTIQLETKLHRAFVILFAGWALVILLLPLIAYSINPTGSGISIMALPLLLGLIVAARALLHLAYTRARNKAIRKMEEIIA